MQMPKRTPRPVKSARGRSRARLGMPRTLRAGRPDRDARAVLRALKLSVRPPEAYSVQRLRGVWRLLAQVLGRRLAMASVTEHFIDGPGGPIAIRVYAASASDELRPAFLWCHGGGFVLGGLESADPICRNIARSSGCVVIAVRYRLAPEHRFPTAVDDSFAAVRWLAGEGAARLGLDGSRLAVGGDSAGGTLAAVCAIQARDAGLPLALQLLVTPGTTAHADTPSHRTFAHGFLLEADAITWFFDHYIDPADRADWRFAPLNAPDLDGVAPAFVLLAECDPLVDEGLAYADALRAAGVPVALELYRGVTHDFIKLGRAIKEAGHAQAAAAVALRSAWPLETKDHP